MHSEANSENEMRQLDQIKLVHRSENVNLKENFTGKHAINFYLVRNWIFHINYTSLD